MIRDVLDTTSGGSLLRRQRAWRQLVGRTLGEITASLGVDPEGSLRIMAGNEAARREVLARAPHILAAWNATAAQGQAQAATRLVCWVNAKVGRRAARFAAQGLARERGSGQAVAPPSASPPADDLEPQPDVADPELRAVLGRIGSRIAKSSRSRSQRTSSEDDDPA